MTGAVKATLNQYRNHFPRTGTPTPVDASGVGLPWQCDSSPQLSPVWPGSQAWDPKIIQKNKRKPCNANETIEKCTEYMHKLLVCTTNSTFKTQPQTLTTAQSWIKERWRFRHAFSDSWTQKNNERHSSKTMIHCAVLFH